MKFITISTVLVSLVSMKHTFVFFLFSSSQVLNLANESRISQSLETYTHSELAHLISAEQQLHEVLCF